VTDDNVSVRAALWVNPPTIRLYRETISCKGQPPVSSFLALRVSSTRLATRSDALVIPPSGTTPSPPQCIDPLDGDILSKSIHKSIPPPPIPPPPVSSVLALRVSSTRLAGPATLATPPCGTPAPPRQRRSWSQQVRQLTPQRGTVAHPGNQDCCVHIHTGIYRPPMFHPPLRYPRVKGLRVRGLGLGLTLTLNLNPLTFNP